MYLHHVSFRIGVGVAEGLIHPNNDQITRLEYTYRGLYTANGFACGSMGLA